MSNGFVANLQSGLKTLVQQELNQYSQEALTCGLDFFKRYESELSDWQQQVASGDMDEDDLRWLLQAKNDLADLEALEDKGLSQVAIDRFVNGLIEVVVAATKV